VTQGCLKQTNTQTQSHVMVWSTALSCVVFCCLCYLVVVGADAGEDDVVLLPPLERVHRGHLHVLVCRGWGWRVCVSGWVGGCMLVVGVGV
jgi:hypothetical protein